MNQKRIFVLTGAGISAESGLSTFRDADGLWRKHTLEEVASIDGYRRNPRLVLDFYNQRRAGLAAAKPNAAHFALADLQQALRASGGTLTLCTQNVDDLHEQAGARDVIHMHGELKKARCDDCGDVTSVDGDLLPELGCAACGRDGGRRPHVVWFGEMPLHMELIQQRLAEAEMFVSIGTSGSVYPAAGYVALANRLGIPTLEINLEPSDNAEVFDAGLYGKATEKVPAWVLYMKADGAWR